MLVFAALVPALWFFYQKLTLNIPRSLVLCPITDDAACTAELATTTFEFYNRCGCMDFCGTLNPKAPLRRSTNMVAWLATESSIAALGSPSFLRLIMFNFFVLAFIIVLGMFGLLESQSSQAGVRNSIFKVFNSDRDWWIRVLYEGEKEDELLRRNSLRFGTDSQRSKLYLKIRFHFARLAATAFYITSIVSVIICPPILITTIVANELFIRIFPQSELSDSVGAWGTWVGAAFVIVAAVIERYHRAWAISVKILWDTLWSHKRWTKEERRSPAASAARRQTRSFFKEVGSPFVHTWYSLWRMYRTARFHLEDFGQWWANPKEKSKEFAPEIKARLKERLKTIRCTCASCAHAKDQQKREMREMERRQRELSIDSDRDDEFEAERAYWAERIQTDIGDAYEITRVKEGVDIPEWAKPSERLAKMQYEYLEKRVRRYLGRSYRIVNQDFLNNASPQSTIDSGLLQPISQSDSQASTADKISAPHVSEIIRPQSATPGRPSVEGQNTPLLRISTPEPIDPEPTAPTPPKGGTESTQPKETAPTADGDAPESQSLVPKSDAQPNPSPSGDDAGEASQPRRSSSEAIHNAP
jgi:hypothetical protein